MRRSEDVYRSFTLANVPTFFCPQCHRETFFLNFEGKGGDIKWRGLGPWMWPDYEEHEDSECVFQSDPFQVWARCVARHCGATSSVHGVVDSDFDQGNDGNYYEFCRFKIVGFSVPPILVDRFNGIPTVVEDELRRAEALIWIDPGASASRIRTVLERLLDSRETQGSLITHQKKRVPLERRLSTYLPEDREFQNLVHAVRWLGNHGTHDTLRIRDAISAFDLIEAVLQREFSPMTDLHRRAAEINRSKGPA